MSSSRVISRGCGECRTRKIKCDLQEPSCARCLKSNRQCPGYRDQLALWFRDESQTVAQRTKATTHTSPSVDRRTQRSLMEEAFEKACASSETVQRGELFLLPMDIFVVDVQDRAACYFFEVFNWVGASTLVEGSFDYKKDAADAPVGEMALLAGITAVGKASLANIHRSDALRESASDDYVTTLNLVNSALCDTEQLKEDSTLNAIFLLSIFEIVVGQERKSIDNWINHIIGASRLLDSRGREDVSKTSSPEMFYSWRSAIVTCCICRKIPFPSIIIRLSHQLASTTRDPLSAAFRDLTLVTEHFANLRHKIDTGELKDAQRTLHDLRVVETDLENWASSISPSCYYDAVSTPQPFQITSNYTLSPYTKYAHKYGKFWIANMWNEFRTIKLQVYDMMLTQLQPYVTGMEGNPESIENYKSQYCHIRRQLCQISEEICCSVPYILGFLANERRDTSLSVKSSAGGVVLLWPLTVAGIANSTVVEFVSRCFEMISHVMGLQQAMVFRHWVLSSSTQYTWADCT